MSATTTTTHSDEKNPDGGDFVQIEKLHTAGLGDDDEPLPFFRRQSFIDLSAFCKRVVQNSDIGMIDGLPGTGKSITLWYNILSLSREPGKSTLWIHLNREGNQTRYIKVGAGAVCEKLKVSVKISDVVESCKEDMVVIDGANHGNLPGLVRMIHIWKTESLLPRTAAFVTMSNKIKRLHPHEYGPMNTEGIGQVYFTQHSWSLDEYKNAMLVDGARSKLMNAKIGVFEKEWEIADDDAAREQDRRTKRCRTDASERKPIASAEEIISQKFFYAGGSARWMFNLTTEEIEVVIKSYIKEAQSVVGLLNFNLGPESPIAKTHLYSSFPDTDGLTEYKVVSERATQLLLESTEEGVVNTLYSHAARINNPAFLGWVVEADFFARCKADKLQLISGGTPFKVPCPTPPVEFDVGLLEMLSSLEDKTKLKQHLARCVPIDEDSVVVCKPKKWNQGGYDVVRIQKNPAASSSGTNKVDNLIRIDLLFGQVTKSSTHSLKLQFFEQLSNLFVTAEYEIGSIEIGFIVPEGHVGSFSVRRSGVTRPGCLRKHTVYGSTRKWEGNQEHELVAVYGFPTHLRD